MNDLKRLLERKADEMRLGPDLPPVIAGRSRRRRVGTAALSLVLVFGIALGSFLGIRATLELAGGPERRIGPAGATSSSPIWPPDADARQEAAENGGQTWWFDPVETSHFFAAQVLRWDEGVQATMVANAPTQVALENPTLAAAAGADRDVTTVLSLERYRGEADGIFIVTAVTSNVISLASPVPGETVHQNGSIRFEGELGFVPEGGRVALEARSANGISDTELPAERRFGRDLSVSHMADPVFAVVTLLSRGDSILAYTAIPLGPVKETGVAPLEPPGDQDTPSSKGGFEASEPVPQPVFETMDAILAAAYEIDWGRLERLIPEEGFTFSYGGEDDPIAYWQGFEGEGETVLDVLVTLLELPTHGRLRGTYVWPEAATQDPGDWDDRDLADIGRIYTKRQVEDFREAGAYLGWRVGIDQDGTWRFFVAGD